MGQKPDVPTPKVVTVLPLPSPTNEPGQGITGRGLDHVVVAVALNFPPRLENADSKRPAQGGVVVQFHAASPLVIMSGAIVGCQAVVQRVAQHLQSS